MQHLLHQLPSVSRLLLKISWDNIFSFGEQNATICKDLQTNFRTWLYTAQKDVYSFQVFDPMEKSEMDDDELSTRFFVSPTVIMAASYPGITPSTLNGIKPTF